MKLESVSGDKENKIILPSDTTKILAHYDKTNKIHLIQSANIAATRKLHLGYYILLFMEHITFMYFFPKRTCMHHYILLYMGISDLHNFFPKIKQHFKNDSSNSDFKD